MESPGVSDVFIYQKAMRRGEMFDADEYIERNITVDGIPYSRRICDVTYAELTS